MLIYQILAFTLCKQKNCTKIKIEIDYLQKDNGFLSFAKNYSQDIGKNISKNLSHKYSQKLHNHAKQSAIGFATRI